MAMTMQGATFKDERGFKGDIDVGLDGTLWIRVKHGDEERRFIVRGVDVVRTALETWGPLSTPAPATDDESGPLAAGHGYGL